MSEPIIKHRWQGEHAITGRTVEWYEQMLTDCQAPAGAQAAAVRICLSYRLNGLCDPAYIANVIHSELQRLNKSEQQIKNEWLTARAKLGTVTHAYNELLAETQHD